MSSLYLGAALTTGCRRCAEGRRGLLDRAPCSRPGPGAWVGGFVLAPAPQEPLSLPGSLR